MIWGLGLSKFLSCIQNIKVGITLALFRKQMIAAVADMCTTFKHPDSGYLINEIIQQELLASNNVKTGFHHIAHNHDC